MSQFTITNYIVYRKNQNLWVEVYRTPERKKAKSRAWHYYYSFNDEVKIHKVSTTTKTTTLPNTHFFRNNGGEEVKYDKAIEVIRNKNKKFKK